MSEETSVPELPREYFDIYVDGGHSRKLSYNDHFTPDNVVVPCGTENGIGRVCTRADGHADNHEARDRDGNAVARWPAK